MNLAEFFDMGGYAFYVWMSYGIALLVLAVNLVLPMRQHKDLLRRIARRTRRQAKQA
ncbi:heme exporter protein CcmD [Sulfuriflexus mobilis]|uniref:heme exporter protein CcmD n=1 Tax=Sulfuriflexus mobilis TaxID=1811807 RepID=UPI000F826DED|nr:heme exporter protein CcmD [Sulfuriflexus mobilis]